MNLTNIKWLVSRLRVMSWRERIFRVGESLNKRTYKPRNDFVGSLDLFEVEVPLLDLVDLEYCRDMFAACKIGVESYGFQWPSHSDGIPEWHKLLNGQDVSRTQSFSLKYRNSDDISDDVRLNWELNRLVWLIPIAVVANVDASVQAQEYLVKVLVDYLKTDKVGYGARWGSSIEMAYQSFSLLTIYHLVQELDLFTSLKPQIYIALRQRQYWIKRFPSKYSSANNHRLAELAALVLLGNKLGDPSKEYEEEIVEFKYETIRQFDSEGLNRELSFDYHLSSYDLLLTVSKYLPEDTLGVKHNELLMKISEATLSIWNFCKFWPSVGDADLATISGSVLQSKNRPLGLVKYSGYELLKTPESSVLTFQSAGYTFLKKAFSGRECILLLDHGNLGFGEMAAHAHADSAALWLWMGTVPWLIEAGNFSYHSNVPLRNTLRSSRLHNTVSINGRSTSLASGAFLWLDKNRAVSTLDSINEQSNSISIITRVPKMNFHATNIVHRRSLEFSGNSIVVVDQISAGHPVWSASHFLIAPEFEELRKREEGVAIFRDSTGNQMRFKYDSDLIVPKLERVKYAPSYGYLDETYQLSFESRNLAKTATIIISIDLQPAN